jgi:hypothetical protein
MIVTFTLQSQYSDPLYVAGPFNISGTTDTNATTELATGITKEQLLTGYTITGISDSVTGGTIASTGICTNTQQWIAFPSQVTPTPTTTSSVTAECWSVLYSTSNPPPSDLYVRYRDYSGTVQTTLLNNLEALDLGNGSILVGLCVSMSGAYSTPVWVQGGLEITTEWLWSNDGTPCTTNGQCLIGN